MKRLNSVATEKLSGSPMVFLPPRRAGHLPQESVLQRRKMDLAPSSGISQTSGICKSEVIIGGVPCLSFLPDLDCATLLYFHGGAFRAGSPIFSAPFCARLAAMTPAHVVCPQYSLAPEDPFPSGLHDALNVLNALSLCGPVVLAGDSAGGGLALACALAARDQMSKTEVTGLALMSPWVDLSLSGQSYETRAATDRLFSRKVAAETAELYLQGYDALHPYASPLHGDLRGLPPCLVFAGCDEVLLDEDVLLAQQLARANVSVELHAVRGAQHVWPTFYPDDKEGIRALQAISRFVSQCNEDFVRGR